MADTFNLGSASPGSSGGLTWVSKSSNASASGSDGILADTTGSAWTLTLPASPSIGTTIGVADNKGGFSSNNLTISGNGLWIMGYAANLVCNKALLSFGLVYSGTHVGWQILPPYGTTMGATKGYRSGGNSGYNATTDRTTFSTDSTVAVTTANLSQGRFQSAGMDGSSAGYVLGGYSGAVVTTADKLTYLTEVTAAQASANLSLARSTVTGLSDGASKGYALGGYTNNATPDGVITADKTTFSNDTTVAQTSADLSQARAFSNGLNAGPGKGYVVGGFTAAGSQAVTTVDCVSYSSDSTAASTASTLGTARGGSSCCPGRTKGFMMGGYTNSAYTSAAVKFTYSSDTSAAATTANIATAKYSPFGYADEADGKGYVLGGFTGSLVRVATAEKLTFSTETTASATSANLSINVAQGASLTNQPAIAWS